MDEAELERFSDEMAERLHTLIKTQFPRSANLEYAILKGHLIVEFALTQYIRGMSRILVDETALVRFTFSHKLEIAYLMGFGINNPVVIPSIERLNKIRNQVAHTFEIDRTIFDEMIRINSDDYDGCCQANANLSPLGDFLPVERCACNPFPTNDTASHRT